MTITITRQGLFSLLSLNRETRIAVTSLRSVQYVAPTPIWNGYITFETGAQPRTFRRPKDALHDRNTVMITRRQMDAFDPLRIAVERAIVASCNHFGPAGMPVSVADELAKLSALHQQGALSEVEFEQAKARLLAP
nr:SHOCT domain-containing protein [Actinoplanes durhamensis]